MKQAPFFLFDVFLPVLQVQNTTIAEKHTSYMLIWTDTIQQTTIKEEDILQTPSVHEACAR